MDNSFIKLSELRLDVQNVFKFLHEASSSGHQGDGPIGLSQFQVAEIRHGLRQLAAPLVPPYPAKPKD